jgi:hypothetical protein
MLQCLICGKLIYTLYIHTYIHIKHAKSTYTIALLSCVQWFKSSQLVGGADTSTPIRHQLLE